MSISRQERQLQRRREALERLMDRVEAGGLEGPVPGTPGVATRSPEDPETLFFHEHGDLVAGLGEVLERSGLEEACLALARHLEEDREHWLRRLALVERESRLRARRAALDLDYLAVLAGHFRRWGAAGPRGERVAELEAGCTLAALRGAQRLWVQGAGRPVLPVLMAEALAVVWPALYAHARRHAPGKA